MKSLIFICSICLNHNTRLLKEIHLFSFQMKQPSKRFDPHPSKFSADLLHEFPTCRHFSFAYLCTFKHLLIQFYSRDVFRDSVNVFTSDWISEK